VWVRIRGVARLGFALDANKKTRYDHTPMAPATTSSIKITSLAAVLAFCGTTLAMASAISTNGAPELVTDQPTEVQQNWNWHIQDTDIVQGDPGFAAKYSGPNSLHDGGEVRETVSLDLLRQ
jgi:hypothetical protein